MSKYIRIKCNKKDCFAYYSDKIDDQGEGCDILVDNDFGKRECPFYKPKKEKKK